MTEKMVEPTGVGALAISGIVTAQGRTPCALVSQTLQDDGAMRRRIFRLSGELRLGCKAQETTSSHWLRCLAGRQSVVVRVTISLSLQHVS